MTRQIIASHVIGAAFEVAAELVKDVRADMAEDSDGGRKVTKAEVRELLQAAGESLLERVLPMAEDAAVEAIAGG